jgi:hypothetical protein
MRKVDDILIAKIIASSKLDIHYLLQLIHIITGKGTAKSNKPFYGTSPPDSLLSAKYYILTFICVCKHS